MLFFIVNFFNNMDIATRILPLGWVLKWIKPFNIQVLWHTPNNNPITEIPRNLSHKKVLFILVIGLDFISDTAQNRNNFHSLIYRQVKPSWTWILFYTLTLTNAHDIIITKSKEIICTGYLESGKLWSTKVDKHLNHFPLTDHLKLKVYIKKTFSY